MEIKISSEHFLKVLYFFSWIIFIGLCIEAGGFLVNGILTLTVNTNDAKYFWREVDLSGLYQHDASYFIVVMVLMIIVAVLKALLFYLIIKLLHDKKLQLSRPFNSELKRFISNMSYLSFGIGLFSYWTIRQSRWLADRAIAMPDYQHLRVAGADVWIFMGVVLLVIAQIFKRGIEIQSENDLTV